ncbi:hypothetical protein [Paraburkholderia sp. 32]|uniref:hypothetical protein n=1 Tax=Paraburkholderia sp. 32 TaxID=2991057 RepID=UPI003D1CD2A7
MQKFQFRTLDGETLAFSINAGFVESTRQHVDAQGAPTAYVAPVSHVVRQAVDTTERCVVIALPGFASEAVEHSATSVTPQVRTRPDGSPVTCALVANGQVAIHADALNEAQPLRGGRLNVLWIFEDCVVFAHYPYDEETDEWFSAAAMVADGHRHEADYRAHMGVDMDAETVQIEAMTFWLIETTR